MDCLSEWVNKTLQKLYFSSRILLLGLPNGEKRAKIWLNWGKNTKSSILKPMMHLKYCNFINGLPEWMGQQNHAEIVPFKLLNPTLQTMENKV